MTNSKTNPLIARILMIALAAVVSAAWSQNDNESVMGSHTFQPEPIRLEIRFTASTDRNIQPLAFRSAGRLMDLYAEAGDQVTKGQPLAKLDTVEIDDEIAIARESHSQSERDLARGMALFDEKVIGIQALEELRHRFTLTNLRLEALSTRLELATITAPEDGVITARFLDYPGFIKRDAPLFHFRATTEAPRLIGTVSQTDANQLSIGDIASIESLGNRVESWSGRITHIQSTNQSGFFEVELAVDDVAPSMEMLPGQIYDVVVALDNEQKAYRIPPELLQFDKQRDNASYVIVSTELGHRLDVEVVRVDEFGAYITTETTKGPIEILLRDF